MSGKREVKPRKFWPIKLPSEPDLGGLEAAYRESNLSSDIELGRLLIWLGIIFVFFYAFIDYQLIGISPVLLELYLVRGLYIISSFVLIRALKIVTVKQFDILISGWYFSMIFVVLFINSTRPESFFYNALVDLVILMTFYIANPVPIIFRVMPGALLTVGDIYLLLHYRPGIIPVGSNSLILGLLLGNFIGALISIQSNTYRRNQFKARYAEQVALKEIERLVITDDLTQVYNRRMFLDLIEQEICRYRRYSHIFSMLVIDLDHFKEINDTQGHLMGDLLLKQFAEFIRVEKRRVDPLARLGGDEFALLLPETSAREAAVIAERMRENCEKKANQTPPGENWVAISIGVTEVSSDDDSFDDVYSRADQALYQAKKEGGNRVKLYLA